MKILLKSTLTLWTFLLILFPGPVFAEKIKLEWTAFKSNNLSAKFVETSIERGKLRFKLIFHNASKDRAYCFYIPTGEDWVHMDDELTNEYKGAEVEIYKNLDNRLRPNQRKIVFISIPAPDQKVALVNLHFYFGSDTPNCRNLTHNTNHWNLHIADWDVTPLFR
jgi:hypothetical protein